MKPSRLHTNRKIYNWLIYNQSDKIIEKYSKYINGHLVDLGCGEAPLKNYFLNFADKYTGIDWSKSSHNVKADIMSDLNKEIKLKNSIADCITSFSLLEHLLEPQNLINESFRVLKSGGVIIFQVPWQWWIHEEPYDYFRYSPYALENMFSKVGFTKIEIEPIGGFFTMLTMKINYFSLRFLQIPKYFKTIIMILFLPFWITSQLFAPILDKLDKNWKAETQGFFIIAWKP